MAPVSKRNLVGCAACNAWLPRSSHLLQRIFIMKAFRTLAALPLIFGLSSAHAALVDLGLSLVIDVSGSISTSEYNLQMDGYGAAFRDPAIQTKLLSGEQGAVAVNAVFFASSAFTTSLDTFQILSSVADLNAFAGTLENFTRPGSGGTDIQDGMAKSLALLTGVGGPQTTNLIMDVSGDGTSSPSAVQTQRDAAAAAGVAVNGLPIGSSFIADFYTNNVITSDGIVVPAASFPDFERAVLTKIEIEAGSIPQVPVPGTLVLVAAGLLGVGLYRRRAATI
jgi:hypothetical protein